MLVCVCIIIMINTHTLTYTHTQAQAQAHTRTHLEVEADDQRAHIRRHSLRDHHTARAGCVSSVLLYPQLRQYLYSCTNQPGHKRDASVADATHGARQQHHAECRRHHREHAAEHCEPHPTDDA